MCLDLVVRRQLVIGNYDLVNIRQTMAGRANNEANPNRQVVRVLRLDYTYNNVVRRLEDNWDHPSLEIDTLLDDNIPLEPSVMFEGTIYEEDDRSDTASHHSSMHQD